MNRFDGKVALVSGFGSGIGQAVAVLFASEGARVLGLSRRLEAAEETLRMIRDVGTEATFVDGDVRSSGDVDRAMAETLQRYGTLDIAVNAAGIRQTGRATDITPEQWDAVIETNLRGTFLVSRAAAAHMSAHGGGSIVNVSAISGFKGPSLRVAYGASKGAVHNLTEAMALDYAREGVRVNCVAPGPTATPMVGEITEDMRTAFGTRIPLGRVGQPEDVAEAIAFLASDAAKHITGAVLPVTGGAHLNV